MKSIMYTCIIRVVKFLAESNTGLKFFVEKKQNKTKKTQNTTQFREMVVVAFLHLGGGKSRFTEGLRKALTSKGLEFNVLWEI